ncbi:hypothetical protein ACKKBF_B09355 [Auxenochlorella protothecoides x Auxenochlorella symbiontica]|uniref:EF-hand domain-containing protein n=1 Tax=Auxenochlorella protothecoides TaxID=3075 RepID=A0A1D1ZZR4_AUXPR
MMWGTRVRPRDHFLRHLLKQVSALTPQLADGTSRSRDSPRYGWVLASAAVASIAGGTCTAVAEAPKPVSKENKGWSLLTLEQRRKVFFKYERKIRDLSPPHKVFEYFASQRHGPAAWMTAQDVMRSVVPVFPPSKSAVLRAGSLWGEPSPEMKEAAACPKGSAFLALDMDRDGRIDYEEWLLFLALLSIPTEDIQVAFHMVDANHSGSIEVLELEALLVSLRKRYCKILPHTGNPPVGDTSRRNAEALMESITGARGGSLTLARFAQFVNSLRDEVMAMEFAFYDVDSKGVMAAQDFAYSVIGATRLKHLDQYLDKVEDMPDDLAAETVTKSDFLAFQHIWRQLRRLVIALEFARTVAGRVTGADLAWVTQHVLGTTLSNTQIKVLEYLFDDGDGGLNIHFLREVMNQSYITGLRIEADDAGRQEKPGVLTCMVMCLKR